MLLPSASHSITMRLHPMPGPLAIGRVTTAVAALGDDLLSAVAAPATGTG